MKIIHCSDLHLDSKMETNLNKEQAKERKNEILITFENMVQYAKNNDVNVIIIAGDLFDKKNISIKTKNIVKNTIYSAPDIDFIYLRGNHDESDFIEFEEIPKNLKTFNSMEWTTYNYFEQNEKCSNEDLFNKSETNLTNNKITISGIEFGEKTNYELYNSLMLEKNNINIVVMHGQESDINVKDKTEIINLKQLKNKNIDYLALGHIHTYKKQKLDNRGIYCYSGCLEGRGFDEIGEKGFVLLEINNSKININFIPFAKRNLYEIKVDISGLQECHEIESEINKHIDLINNSSLVKIILVGEVELGVNKDISYLLQKFEKRFYFFKIYDKTITKIDYMKYQFDASLKGEFIRLVLQQELSESEKAEIINIGIKALSGEEI